MKNLLVLFLWLSSGIAFSQTPTKGKVVTAINQQATTATPSNAEKERDFYKLMYENTSASNEKFIALTQWTLGASLAVILGIIGSQIYFNYRINKKEMDSLSAGLQEQIARLELDVTQRITTVLNVATTSLETEKKALSKELKEVINKQFVDNEKMLDVEFKLQKGDLLLEINRLKCHLKKSQGDIWYLRDVKANALSYYIEAAGLEAGFSLGNEKYLLEDVIKVLGEVEDMSHSDYEALQKLLPRIKVANYGLKTKLEGIIKDKPTYRFLPKSADSFPYFLGMPAKQYTRNKPA